MPGVAGVVPNCGGMVIELGPLVALGSIPILAAGVLPSSGAPTGSSHTWPGSPCAGFNFTEPSVGVLSMGIEAGDASTASTCVLVGSEEHAVIKKALQTAIKKGVECMVVLEGMVLWY